MDALIPALMLGFPEINQVGGSVLSKDIVLKNALPPLLEEMAIVAV